MGKMIRRKTAGLFNDSGLSSFSALVSLIIEAYYTIKGIAVCSRKGDYSSPLFQRGINGDLRSLATNKQHYVAEGVPSCRFE